MSIFADITEAFVSLDHNAIIVRKTRILPNNSFQYLPPPPGYGYGYGPGPFPPVPPPGYGYGYGYGYPCKKREAGFEEMPKDTERVVMPTLNE
ncbi:hypothetical protein Y032_0562g3497 [Ancylostoma ceylanicum]|nr:hypothetical protein Y032_0562g3497 [Ancylostoma ceylanicum]